MNNPLEFILRKQKMAQGGRIGLYEGGPSDREGFGFGNFGKQGKSAPGSLGKPGGGNKSNNPYGGGPGGLHSNYAEDDTSVSDDTSNNQNQNQTTTTTEPDDTQYTNNFLDAIFNKDLSFKFDPKMDYVDRVYGRLPNHIKNRIANKLGIDDFDSYLDANYESLYNQDNITGSDIANMFTSAQNYFTGIPNAIANYNPTMPTQQGLQTLGQKVFGGIFGNPVTSFMGMNPLGFPVGMFTSLVTSKGPFTKESIESGDFANLANAPADYQKAVQQAMGGTFSPEQMAQIASGQAAKAEEQKNTKGGTDPTAEERAALQAQMERQSIEAYKNTLTEPQLRVYERLAEQGYNDDYIRAYLGFL